MAGNKYSETEMPLMKGTLRSESASTRKVHGVAEVRVVLADVTDGNGVRDTLLCFIAGDQMVVVENNGKVAQQWMKEEIQKALGITSKVGSI